MYRKLHCLPGEDAPNLPKHAPNKMPHINSRKHQSIRALTQYRTHATDPPRESTREEHTAGQRGLAQEKGKSFFGSLPPTGNYSRRRVLTQTESSPANSSTFLFKKYLRVHAARPALSSSRVSPPRVAQFQHPRRVPLPQQVPFKVKRVMRVST